MARISVEHKALIDPRFRLVGSGLEVVAKSTREAIERAMGLHLAMLVWHECTERGTYKLKPEIVEAIHDGLVAALIAADLAEWRGKLLRIKGTEGRTDWKAKQTENGRVFGPLGAEHGKKGGRPLKRKTPQGVSEKRGEGDSEKPPSSSSSSSSSSSNTHTQDARAQNLDDQSTVPKWLPGMWEKFWQAYPKKSYEDASRHRFEMLLTTHPKPDELFAEIMAGLQRWKQSDEWARNVINSPNTWLDNKRWKEHPDADGKRVGPTRPGQSSKVRSGLERGDYDNIPDHGKTPDVAG